MKIKLEIIGYVGKDATIIQNSSENSTIQFNVAHSESYTDKNGTKTDRTTWVSCFYRRKANQTGLAQYLKKGTLVAVEGVPTISMYTDRAGITRPNISLAVSQVTLLSAKTAAPETQVQNVQAEPQTYQAEPEYTDLPF